MAHTLHCSAMLRHYKNHPEDVPNQNRSNHLDHCSMHLEPMSTLLGSGVGLTGDLCDLIVKPLLGQDPNFPGFHGEVEEVPLGSVLQNSEETKFRVARAEN